MSFPISQANKIERTEDHYEEEAYRRDEEGQHAFQSL